MEKNRGTKIVAVVALFIAVIGLSIGFAAFSSTLTINSSATVSANDNLWKVGFSSTSNGSIGSATSVTATTNGTGVTADTATLAATSITNVKAKFTEPGQTVTYTFYTVNRGSLDAYLKSVTFSGSKSCTADTTYGNGTSIATADQAQQSLATSACSGITYTVKIGEQTYSSDTTVSSGNAITKASGSEQVTVTISYGANAQAVDGPVTVTLPSIVLGYDSVEY